MNNTTATTEPTKRQEFLTDILTTAVEGGINYWAQVADYAYSGPVDGRGVTLVIDDVDEQDILTRVITADADTVTTTITLRDIDRGLKTLIRMDFKVADYIKAIAVNAHMANDCCPETGDDVDAEVAEIIIQAAVFGELVFG